VAEIKPFRGWRYSLAKVGKNNLREVVCAPYDVMGWEAQQRYLERNRHNIVRLELGETFPEDNSDHNRYTRAATVLQNWKEEGLLLQDSQPFYYLYEQEFTLNGRHYRRQSLMAALRLEEYSRGIVLPHERILAHTLTERLALLKAIKINLNAVFCLYDDSEGQVDYLYSIALEEPPLYQFADEWNHQHRLYPIHQPKLLALLTQAFADKKLYLADGHHRYQTALNYQAERQGSGDLGCNPVDYIMVALTAFQDAGLCITPLHRTVSGLGAAQVAKLELSLTHFFHVEEVSLADKEDHALFAAELVQHANTLTDYTGEEHHVLGMYYLRPEGTSRFLLLKLKSVESAARRMPPYSKAWQRQEVAILHSLILEGFLGLSDQSKTVDEQLGYTRHAHEALARVNNGTAQLAFLLPPTRLPDLRAVADTQEPMPPKSTYFYPKFMTGLVMRPLD